MKGGKAMKKKYTFTLEPKLVENLNDIVKASQEAGHSVSKSELVEIAVFHLIKNIVAHSQEVKKGRKA